MGVVRCIDCKYFQPDAASLRMGTCLHAEPWDGSKEYLQLGLPPAPAAMVGEEVMVQGPNLSEDQVEAAIRRHLGLPALEPPKKGFLGRIFGK